MQRIVLLDWSIFYGSWEYILSFCATQRTVFFLTKDRRISITIVINFVTQLRESEYSSRNSGTNSNFSCSFSVRWREMLLVVEDRNCSKLYSSIIRRRKDRSAWSKNFIKSFIKSGEKQQQILFFDRNNKMGNEEESWNWNSNKSLSLS